MKPWPELIIGFIGSSLSIVVGLFSWGYLSNGMWLFVAGVVSLGALIPVLLRRNKRTSGIIILACGTVILIILNSIMSGSLLVISGIMLFLREGDKKGNHDTKKK